MQEQNPPTAKRGIRGTLIPDDKPEVQPFLPPPEDVLAARNAHASAPETTLVNTVQRPSEFAQIPTSFDPELPIQRDGSGAALIRDGEQLSAIVEAIHAHRAMLHGLLARKELEPSLNPGSREHELGAIKRGIARADQLLRELEPEPSAD